MDHSIVDAPYGEIVENEARFGQDVSAFARVELEFTADAKQMEVLTAGGKRVMLCCSRQWGKSTVAAVLATHHLLSQPKAVIGVMCPVESQAAELLRKVREFLTQLHIPFTTDRIHRQSIELKGGARMMAVSSRADSVRGLSAVTLLIVDEAAYVADDVYDALRPALAVSGGTIWLISTPADKQGFFWQSWEKETVEEWKRFLVTAKDCPRLSAEFLQEELRTRGERRFRQEYECEFLEDLRAVWNVDLLLTSVAGFRPLEA